MGERSIPAMRRRLGNLFEVPCDKVPQWHITGKRKTMMVTGEVIQQVFRIARGDNIGTAFTIAWGGRQFLVTARHVLEPDDATSLPLDIDIEIFHEERWKPLRCRVFGYCPEPLDIALLGLPFLLTGFANEVDIGSKGLVYSQQVFFLGFPFGRFGRLAALNNGYPFPFVKTAIVSMINHDVGGERLITLDGINNPGFSGGPVVFRNGDRSPRWQIAGVVVSHDIDSAQVYGGSPDSNMSVDINTGLVYVCPLDAIFPVLHAHSHEGVPFELDFHEDQVQPSSK